MAGGFVVMKPTYKFGKNPPDMLRLNPDGSLTLKDGWDVKEYLRQWYRVRRGKESFSVAIIKREDLVGIIEDAKLLRSFGA